MSDKKMGSKKEIVNLYTSKKCTRATYIKHWNYGTSSATTSLAATSSAAPTSATTSSATTSSATTSSATTSSAKKPSATTSSAKKPLATTSRTKTTFTSSPSSPSSRSPLSLSSSPSPSTPLISSSSSSLVVVRETQGQQQQQQQPSNRQLKQRQQWSSRRRRQEYVEVHKHSLIRMIHLLPVEQRDNDTYAETSFVNAPRPLDTANDSAVPSVDSSVGSGQELPPNEGLDESAAEAERRKIDEAFFKYTVWVEMQTILAEKCNAIKVKPMCDVCTKCRCVQCRRNCQFLRMKICGLTIRTNGWLNRLPCVYNNGPCDVCCEIGKFCNLNHKIVGPCSERCNRPVDTNTIDVDGSSTPRRASSISWQLCAMLCFCWPCLRSCDRSLKCIAICSESCEGNDAIEGCRCVDWGALKEARRQNRDVLVTSPTSSPSNKTNALRENLSRGDQTLPDRDSTTCTTQSSSTEHGRTTTITAHEQRDNKTVPTTSTAYRSRRTGVTYENLLFNPSG